MKSRHAFFNTVKIKLDNGIFLHCRRQTAFQDDLASIVIFLNKFVVLVKCSNNLKILIHPFICQDIQRLSSLTGYLNLLSGLFHHKINNSIFSNLYFYLFFYPISRTFRSLPVFFNRCDENKQICLYHY